MTATPIALAEAHRVTQVRQAAVFQNALGASFSKLDPAALDASFPTYLRSALAVVSAGRSKAGSLASFYYGQSREAAGLQSLIGAIHVPDTNVASVTASLLITGPVSVKTQLANGVALQAAMNSAKAQTLRAGKRHILNASREALIAAVHNDADALGWARMSDGQPCHFCAMLVSRGPVYKREGTGTFRSHDGCGCGVRPFFGDDPTGGWTDDARALRELWDATPSQDWRMNYRAATLDPTSKVFTAFADKVGAQISSPLVEAAKKAATAAYAEAQALKAAATEAAKHSIESEAARLAADVAAAEAKAAAKEAAKIKKWLGKPAPKKPIPPTPAAKVGEAAFDGWLQEAKDRFAAYAASTGNPKSDLTKSLNWDYFQRVVKQHDDVALTYLRTNNYIDDAMVTSARAAMKHAESPIPGYEAAYKKALTAFRRASTTYDRYLLEWRDVNGVTGGQLRGMSDDVVRHFNDTDGVRWADTNLKTPSGTGASAQKAYTGSSYTPWNAALRANAGPNVPAGKWATKTKQADAGFFPAPEDFIVNRGTNWDELALDDAGTRRYSIPPPPPEDLIGTVQVQHGYWSTSVGKTSAFSGQVNLRLRVPKDHGVSWTMPISQIRSEREMLIQRSSNFFIHDIYKDVNGRWIVEAEVIPMDVDAATFVGTAPSPSTDKFSAY